MKDIQTQQDIEQLIEEFYGQLLELPSVKPIFEGLDFKTHVPKIVAFWSMVLLDQEGYKTNVFDKHLHLPLKEAHFDIWLETFVASVNRLFKGEKANLAIQRATLLTYTFKSKWQHLNK